MLRIDLFSYYLFFCGRRKIQWTERDGLCLFTRRLGGSRFVRPVTRDGEIHLTPAQLSMFLKGINWKRPQRMERPSKGAVDGVADYNRLLS